MSLREIAEIKNQLKIINIIHISLMSGLLLFFIVAVVFLQSNMVKGNKIFDKIFIIIVPVYGLMMIFISKTIFNLMISKFSSGIDLSEKVAKYRSAKTIFWALVESGCLLALVATLFTSDYLYIVVFLFLLGYFFMLRPSRQSLTSDLRFNPDETNLMFE